MDTTRHSSNNSSPGHYKCTKSSFENHMEQQQQQPRHHLLPDAKYVVSFAAKITRLAQMAARSKPRASEVQLETGTEA